MDTTKDLQSVVVVGGCGFLGHRIVVQLLEVHPLPQVFVLDQKTDRNRVSSVTYHDVDITDKTQLSQIIHQIQPQVIIHTASPSPSMKDLGLYLKVNVDGTRNLLECAEKTTSIRGFIYTSSASVVHDAESDLIDGDETLPLVFLPKQKEVYSHTKALADQLVITSNRKFGNMQTVCIRPSGLFGERDPTAVKPMIEAAKGGKYKFQMGTGKNKFDWTYIENAAYAHILAAQKLLAQPSTSLAESQVIGGEAFLITNDEPVFFWDFARALGAAAGFPTKKEEVITIPRFVGLTLATIVEWLVWMTSFGRRKPSITRTGIKYSCMTRTFRIDKAKQRLGYKPKVDMKEGIRRSAESFMMEMQSKKTK